ncbi:MAG: 4Fe-4S dicluster domain-containing protein [Desulfobacterales bacterium]|nr:4Fe-4S dicluster domain-containing protein [Desulfobacterales bacterium]
MTIRFEPEDNPHPFFEQMELLCGDDFYKCYQCGSCASSCPMTEHMEASPRKIMHLVRFGLGEKLAQLNTFWVCATCLCCQVNCPRGIDVARVMEALRTRTLRQKKDYLEPSRQRIAPVSEYPQIALVGAFRKLAC